MINSLCAKIKLIWTGFIQSLEFLKFANQFFRPEKNLENKDIVWKKMVKSLEFLESLFYCMMRSFAL